MSNPRRKFLCVLLPETFSSSASASASQILCCLMATQADHQKQITLQSPCLMGENDNYKHAKHDQGDQWTLMIMEGDYHHQDRLASSASASASASASLEDSSISNRSSASSSELVDDASSTSTSSSTNSPSSSSSDVANGPHFELSELMAQLPIKRGLSKYYQGKSQSFTSLSRVITIEDLAKKETPYRKKMKTCKSYGGGLDIKATISKKLSRSSLYSTSSLSAARKGSFLGSSKPPLIPVQKHF